MHWRWIGLAVITGLLVPAQGAMNSRMRLHVVNPMYSSLVNFVVGLLAGIAVTVALVYSGYPGKWRGATDAPWWAWCGGFIGALYVTTTVLCVPKIGSSNVIASIVAGQLIGSLIVDHFGWLGLEQRTITLSRLVGGVVLLVGVWLIQRPS